LLALVVLAAVVLGSFLWIRVQSGASKPSSGVDFGDRLRQLAAERGVGGSDLVADEPIRKIDGVFVRSWRFSVSNLSAMEALQRDIIAAADHLHGTVSQVQTETDQGTRMRLEFAGEAFDLELILVHSERYARQQPSSPEAMPKRSPTATPRPRPAPNARGRLAILLDDAGQSKDLLPLALALPKEIAVSILPFLPHTSDVAGAMHRSGHEVWLHLPMEPQGYPKNDPGAGAVLVSMSADDIRIAVHTALNNVPHAIGANNHMGSKASADLRVMTWVMQELKARGMMFIDSRTTRGTVAEEAAMAQGVPTGRRHVFLDNERTRSAIRRQLDEAVYRCRLEGDAIAIGHLAKVTLEVLDQEIPTLSKRGADLVVPSALVK